MQRPGNRAPARVSDGLPAGDPLGRRRPRRNAWPSGLLRQTQALARGETRQRPTRQACVLVERERALLLSQTFSHVLAQARRSFDPRDDLVSEDPVEGADAISELLCRHGVSTVEAERDARRQHVTEDPGEELQLFFGEGLHQLLRSVGAVISSVRWTT